ncbi:MAG TPA: transglycosylase SLT domain-containing protein [Trebonia sp.]|nr:transglycosylase SLT domain-containing protein [Trebonia sp.]
MTLAQVRELARSVGFPNPELAAAIAYAESNGFPRILGDEGTSFGLWQVNRPSHPDLASADLLDPLVNARAALAISRGGTDFTPWTQYRTGAYQKYLALQGTA